MIIYKLKLTNLTVFIDLNKLDIYFLYIGREEIYLKNYC